MKPYGGEKTKQEEVRSMFDGIAPRYDLLNRILSLGIDRRWRKKLVRRLRHDRPGSVLDIATGTGDLAFAALKACPQASVTGLDLSEGMLTVARRRAAHKGIDKIVFMQGEAEKLPFQSESFDAVTIAFGVRNFEDIPAGLAECSRVLNKGGRVYILEFSTPKSRVFGAVYGWYFHRVVPLVGGIVSRDAKAYDYLPSSVDEFPSAAQFCEMMGRAGLTDCTYRRLTNGVACLYTGTAVKK